MTVYLITDAWIKTVLENHEEFRPEIEGILDINMGTITTTVKGDSDWASYICRAMVSISASDRIIQMYDPYLFGSFEGNIEVDFALLIGKQVEVISLSDNLWDEMRKFKEEK